MNSITSDKVRELGFGGRKFQLDAYNKFYGKRFTINVSPTGSGKSLVQVFCAAREIIETNYKQKQVFIVPQLDIGNGFSDHKHEYLKMNGKIYEWETTNNFCSDSKDSVKKIKKFLTTNIDYSDKKANNIIGGVTAVVSYSALVHAFKSMTKKEKLKMIENTSFRIDEGHHVCGVEDDFVPNKMGEITKFILDNNGHYHITTATLFRGDYQPIVGREYLKKFCIFRVPFLDHWNTLGIDKLNYNFESYQSAEDLFKKIVSNIKKNPQQRPMIILPADNQKYFKYENKWSWTKKLVYELEKVFGTGKVLDLISDDTQDASKARLGKSEQDFYAIVTCSIGREGTDWPACNYVHNTTLDNNLVLAIQKLGRVMRQYAGKTQVYFTNYIEHFPKWDSDREDIRCRLSDRFNAIFASNMIDDLFSPVVMPKLPKKKQENDDDKSDNSDDTQDTASLDDVFGPVKGEVVEEIMNEVWKIKQNDLSPDKVEKIIEEVIENHNDDILVNVDLQSLKDRLMLEVARIQDPKEEKLKIKGCIVDFIREGGWDKIIRKSLKEGSPFVGEVDAIDLTMLQEFLSKNDNTALNLTKKCLEDCINLNLNKEMAADKLNCGIDSIDKYSISAFGKTYGEKILEKKETEIKNKITECIKLGWGREKAEKYLDCTRLSLRRWCKKYFNEDSYVKLSKINMTNKQESRIGITKDKILNCISLKLNENDAIKKLNCCKMTLYLNSKKHFKKTYKELIKEYGRQN